MDFQVRRRRKRAAVDPCLGYYEDIAEPLHGLLHGDVNKVHGQAASAESAAERRPRHNHNDKDTGTVTAQRQGSAATVAESPSAEAQTTSASAQAPLGANAQHRPFSRISELPHVSPKSLPKYLPDVFSARETVIGGLEGMRQGAGTGGEEEEAMEAVTTVNDFLNRVGNSSAARQVPGKRYSTRRKRRNDDLSGRQEKPLGKREQVTGPKLRRRVNAGDIGSDLSLWRMPDVRVGGEDDDDDDAIVMGVECSSSPPFECEEKLRLRSRAVRRVVLSSDSEMDASDSDQDSSSASEFGPPSPKTRLSNARRQRIRKSVLLKPLGTRLFEASVSTGGNPLDSLVLPKKPTEENDQHVLSTRKPLHFVPVLLHDDMEDGMETSTLKRRAVTLVDPRRVAPFTGASFCTPSQRQSTRTPRDSEGATSTTSATASRSREYGRISNWKTRVVPPSPSAHLTTQNSSALQKRRGGHDLESGEAPVRASYPPLVFVPLAPDENGRRDSVHKTKKVKNK